MVGLSLGLRPSAECECITNVPRVVVNSSICATEGFKQARHAQPQDLIVCTEGEPQLMLYCCGVLLIEGEANS